MLKFSGSSYLIGGPKVKCKFAFEFSTRPLIRDVFYEKSYQKEFRCEKLIEFLSSRVVAEPRAKDHPLALNKLRGEMSDGNSHSNKHAARNIPAAQYAFKISMIHCDLQVALRIAFRCVLHRCGIQDIHC